jgi:hypothetical protein
MTTPVQRAGTRSVVVLLAVALFTAGCHVRPSVRGTLPAHEQATIHAGVDLLPPHANLSIDTTRAPGLLDPGRMRAQRIAYLHETRLGLGLIRRYVLRPYGKGRFTVAGDVGPSATTIGRAAAAVTSAVETLDTALESASVAMRAPTLQLRDELLALASSLRRGDTVTPATVSLLQQLTSALVTTGSTAHLRIKAGRAPSVTPLRVSPLWHLRVRRERAQVRRLVDNGLGALTRYVVKPELRGRFSPTLWPLTRARVQHRALEALGYAMQQWSEALTVAAPLSRLRPLDQLLTAARVTLATDAVAARRGTLTAAMAARTRALIDRITSEGRRLQLTLRAGRSPTFAT